MFSVNETKYFLQVTEAGQVEAKMDDKVLNLSLKEYNILRIRTLNTALILLMSENKAS